MTIVNTTMNGNSASIGGGAIHNDASMNTARVVVSNSTFGGNSSHAGGAIYNDGDVCGLAVLTLSNTTFSDNSADNVGDSIYNLSLCDRASRPC